MQLLCQHSKHTNIIDKSTNSALFHESFSERLFSAATLRQRQSSFHTTMCSQQ